VVGAVVLASTGAACLALRERRAALAVAACTLVVPLVWAVKQAIGRARPEDAVATGLALPSGHAAMAVVAYGAVALFLAPATVRRVGGQWLRPAATGLWLGLAIAVGVARVAAGVHWPTDVIAGWAFGGLVLALAAAVAGSPQADDAPGAPTRPV
jgi:undecaprenyl-diphosphatase